MAENVSSTCHNSALICLCSKTDMALPGYCGNSLASSSDEAPLEECNMLCGGDASQYCGAGNRLELYSTTASQPSSTSSTPTPTPDPFHRDKIGDYTLIGCWVE